RTGIISRDTWVLTSKPQNHISLWLQSDQRQRALQHSFSLPSRAAENLFWVARYAERAEASARLLRTILAQSLQSSIGSEENRHASQQQLLRALTQLTLTFPGFLGKGSEKRLKNPEPELKVVAFSDEQYGSIHNNIQALMRAASSVRDLWSNDTWRLLQNIDEAWTLLHKTATTISLYHLWEGLNNLITQLMAFAGLNYESMTHGTNWLMLDSGRRIERAQMTMALVGALVTEVKPPPVEALLLEHLLVTTENIITYRRRYRSYLQLDTVLEQLLLDQTNPRAVIYQLDTLQAHLAKLPRQMEGFRLSEEERLVLQANTKLRLSEMADLLVIDPAASSEQVAYHHLGTLLTELDDLLSQTAQTITHYYFSHVQVAQPLIGTHPGFEQDIL
ncbi:MAG: alpha-E domain-containing protein, partial [Anaerolineae bacterium]|nr:alpha-E domain-containing protein [Anaerolineae bacterium]